MGGKRERRSPRLALELPIRVYGFDYHGIDFVEDSKTSVVNQHGAKICLTRNLIPEQEIRILCRQTEQEAVFRVVGKAAGPVRERSFWGVECVGAADNIWGVDFPAAKPKDQRWVRVMMQCSECRSRELLYFDEHLVEAVEQTGGLLRGCLTCGKSGRWRLVPYSDS